MAQDATPSYDDRYDYGESVQRELIELREDLKQGLVKINVPSGRIVYGPPAVKAQLEGEGPDGSDDPDDQPEWNRQLSFEEDRDDAYFAELMAQAPVAPVSEEAVATWIANAEAAEAAQRTKELDELRFLWHLDDNSLRYDKSKRSFRWWTPDDTSFFPDPEVIDERNVPAVVMFRSTTWDLPSYTYQEKTSYTPQELLAYLLPPLYKSPAAGDLPHRTIVTDSEDAVQLREAMDDDMLTWLHRDEDENEVLHRWNHDAEADMTDEEKQQRLEDRNEWRTTQTAFLRRKLHKLLKVYFRTNDYRERSIVTRWSDDHRTPLEQTNILLWIEERVTERGELSGYASLCRSIEYRIAKRRDRAGKNEAAWVKAA